MLNLRRLATLWALLAALLGCAASGDSRPSWTGAADIDIAGYSTFGWADRSGRPPVTILDNHIRSAIRAELLDRGYVEASGAPDLLIQHETVERETVKQGSPVRIGFGVGTRSGNLGGSVGTSVDVGEKDQRLQQLRVDIRATTRDDREAWVGTTAPLTERPDQPAIERAVAGVMKGFPDKRP